jgi:sugar O-acyltransferase (sialic acid O-acetyltransferase NeuD family)
MIKELKIPRFNSNDDRVLISEWSAENKTKVKKGDDLFVVETSKGVVAVQAESDGYLFITSDSYSYYAVDDIVAYICDSIDEFTGLNEKIEEKEKAPVSMPNITAKALTLAQKYNIDISQMRSDKIIQEKDIKALIEEHENTKPVQIKKYTCNDIIILCGGGLCKMGIDAIRSRGGLNIHGIIDYGIQKGTKIMEIEVLGPDEILNEVYTNGIHSAVNAMGSITIDNTSSMFFKRKALFEKLKSIGFNLPNVIHVSASVSPTVKFGEGNLVFENAIIGTDAIIGDDSIINSGTIISHDCVIGDHCRISPGAILAGSVTVGENTLIGMGTSIYVGIHIGKNVIIANGKHIFSDVPDNMVIK